MAVFFIFFMIVLAFAGLVMMIAGHGDETQVQSSQEQPSLTNPDG